MFKAIHQLAILSVEIDASVESYRDKLGARFVAKFDPRGLAFFDVGGVRLMLERNAPKGTVYFRVDDTDAAFKKLRARGVDFIDEPHPIHRDAEGLFGAAGEKEWMAFFNDPCGNLLAIAQRKPAGAV